MNKNWLPTSILVLVAGIVLLTTGHYAVCQFWANPKQWALYERTNGRLPDTEHTACKDVGARSMAAMTSVLATLLALHSQPPGDL